MHVYEKGCFFKSLEDIRGCRVTVMGLGLNGGGEASAAFFARHGAYVTVTDLKSARELSPSVELLRGDASLDQSRLRFVLGEHRIEDFSSADCVIKNPSVKIDGNKFLSAARAIETDISVFLRFTKSPIVAITGSKGKSSTASALAWALKQAGLRAFLGGNITVSPLGFLEQTDEETPVVLELSSWQLADLRGRGVLKPRVAIITAIVPDHQNWYSNMDDYVADKRVIYADQSADDYTIAGFDRDGYARESASPEPGARCWGDVFACESPACVLRYSARLLPAGVYGAFLDEAGEGRTYLPGDKESQKAFSTLLAPGAHTKLNVLNACLALRLLGVDTDAIPAAISGWPGVPHRLELFYEWRAPDGAPVRFYDDSCATVPEAACAAIRGAFARPVILIAGGTDKRLDFLPLARALDPGEPGNAAPCAIYLLSGSGTDKLVSLLDARGVRYEGPFDSLADILYALKSALTSDALPRAGAAGDALPVVFSPGATSFEHFLNEFDRGDKFKEAVREIFK